jgi:AraC-like DNA-binding protein
MFEHALLIDADGKPIEQGHRTHSEDWDEVRTFCDKVYMPYYVRPVGRFSRPNACMYSAKVGQITVTRFSYGVPVHLKDFSPEAGNILVLTTLRGHLRHSLDSRNSAITGAGESFLADCSRTEYWLDGDEHHLQLNLTIPHDLMERTALDGFGFIPDDGLWRKKVKFGGSDSAWLPLLDYLVRTISAMPGRLEKGRVSAHLEQVLCFELLKTWAAQTGFDLDQGGRSAAPHYVRRAEIFMRENARAVPTLAEVARAAGVSVRALSGAFRRFRNMTPMAFMRERRLQGIRKDLLTGGDGQTVTAVASRWGYVNLGVFANAYKHRFGELPSETLRRTK